MGNQILYTFKMLKPLGYAPQADWLKRSYYDQYMLYKAGKSKCDGTNKISEHQNAKAIDLLVIGPDKKTGELTALDPMEVCPQEWILVRKNWTDMGGEAMIPWDPCHFEVQ